MRAGRSRTPFQSVAGRLVDRAAYRQPEGSQQTPGALPGALAERFFIAPAAAATTTVSAALSTSAGAVRLFTFPSFAGADNSGYANADRRGVANHQRGKRVPAAGSCRSLFRRRRQAQGDRETHRGGSAAPANLPVAGKPFGGTKLAAGTARHTRQRTLIGLIRSRVRLVEEQSLNARQYNAGMKNALQSTRQDQCQGESAHED